MGNLQTETVAKVETPLLEMISANDMAKTYGYYEIKRIRKSTLKTEDMFYDVWLLSTDEDKGGELAILAADSGGIQCCWSNPN